MPKILVITDDAPSRHLFDALLNLHGYVVLFVESDRQGLELFRHTCPDVVVLDLNIPEMGAISMLREVRRLNATQQVIVLSGEGTSKTEACVRVLGVREVIERHSLVKTLERMINHAPPERTPTLPLSQSEWKIIS
jgi:DNA-binding response OmpR family regulator